VAPSGCAVASKPRVSDIDFCIRGSSSSSSNSVVGGSAAGTARLAPACLPVDGLLARHTCVVRGGVSERTQRVASLSVRILSVAAVQSSSCVQSVLRTYVVATATSDGRCGVMTSPMTPE